MVKCEERQGAIKVILAEASVKQSTSRSWFICPLCRQTGVSVLSKHDVVTKQILTLSEWEIVE